MSTASNQKVILLPYEATALLGTLGGMGELAKAAFGGLAKTPVPHEPSES